MKAAAWLLGMSIVSALGAPSAKPAAPIYPWCTTGAGHEFGARNCGFVSFEQCMQTARGNGQNCERNPLSVDAENAAPRNRKSPRTADRPSR
jgi:hypothetical protein